MGLTVMYSASANVVVTHEITVFRTRKKIKDLDLTYILFKVLTTILDTFMPTAYQIFYPRFKKN